MRKVEGMYKYYSVIKLHPYDILVEFDERDKEELVFFTEDEMQRIADLLGESLMRHFWEDLRQAVAIVKGW